MTDNTDNNWERATLEKLAFAALKEQRRARNWSIFFKLLFFAYFTVILVLALGGHEDGLATSGKHTAMVTMEGVIEAKGDASAEKITGALQGAFEDKNT